MSDGHDDEGTPRWTAPGAAAPQGPAAPQVPAGGQPVPPPTTPPVAPPVPVGPPVAPPVPTGPQHGAPAHGQYGQPSQYAQPGQYGPPAQYGQPGQYGQPANGGWGAPPGWAGSPGYGPPPAGPGWRPPALQPGIIPLRPLNLGEILDGAFRAVRADPRVMFGLSALVVAVAVILESILTWYVGALVAEDVSGLLDDSAAVVDDSTTDALSTSIGQLISLPISSVATTVLTGLLIVSVSRSVLGRRTPIAEILRSHRVWWVLGFTILLGLAVLLAFGLWIAAIVPLAMNGDGGTALLVGVVGGLALVVGVFWVQVRTLLVAPALMLEGKGFRPTIARAWRLTRGSFWRLLGIYLLVSILASIVGQVILVPATIISGLVFDDPLGQSLGSVVVNGIAQTIAMTLTTVFLAAVVALLYIDVRMRREGLDVELARAAGAPA